MEKKIKRYDFDRISSRMSQRFGSIRRGDEEAHTFTMFCMESNLLKLHREDKKRDSRRAVEAIHICLLTIDGYLTDTTYDMGAFLSEENQAMAQGLLMSFDPFTNEEIKEILGEDRLGSAEALEAYFEEPAKCLVRLEKSVEMWLKARGQDGYFQYIEDLMGDSVKRDTKMEFAIPADLAGTPEQEK